MDAEDKEKCVSTCRGLGPLPRDHPAVALSQLRKLHRLGGEHLQLEVTLDAYSDMIIVIIVIIMRIVRMIIMRMVLRMMMDDDNNGM